MSSCAAGGSPRAPRASDPEVLELVEEPYTGVGETRQRLWSLLDAFEDREDPRADFLRVYARMTDAVAERVRRGDFADPEWVGEYLVAFANRYREAVRDHETGDLISLAVPWRLAFAAADGRPPMQNAALGVNAHINYDLALALSEVGIDENTEARRADHEAITDVIARIFGEVWGALTASDGGSATDGRSLKRPEEAVAVLAIDACRDSAWRIAVALNSRLGLRRRLARVTTAATATAGAHVLLGSRPSDVLGDVLPDGRPGGRVPRPSPAPSR